MPPYMLALLLIAGTNVVKVAHDQIHAGTPADLAIRSAIAGIESHIPNDTVRTLVHEGLSGLISGLENGIAKAADSVN